jgi:hypothetical protein
MVTRDDVFDIIENALYENLLDLPDEEVKFVTQKIMDKLEDKGVLEAMDVYDTDPEEDFDDGEEEDYTDDEDYSEDEEE